MLKDNTGSLWDHKIFKFCFLGSFFFPAVSIAAIAIINRDVLSFCPEPRCLSNFLELYELPLKAGAALLGYAGVIGLVFRSQQTAQQIAEIESSNKINNYFKHKEEIIKSLSNACEKRGFVLQDGEKCYRLLFPFNSPTSMSVKSEKDADGQLFLKRVFDDFYTKMHSFDEPAITPESSPTRTKLRQTGYTCIQTIRALTIFQPVNTLANRTESAKFETNQLLQAAYLLNYVRSICLLEDCDLKPLPNYSISPSGLIERLWDSDSELNSD